MSAVNIKHFINAVRQELMSLVDPHDHAALAGAFDASVANVSLDHLSKGTDITELTVPEDGSLHGKPRGKQASGKPAGSPKNKILPGSPEAKERARKAQISRKANAANKAAAEGSATTPTGVNTTTPVETRRMSTTFGGASLVSPGGVVTGPGAGGDGAA